MRIIKCNFCGAEVEEPYDVWGENHEVKKWSYITDRSCNAIKRDICPRCVPKAIK